MNQNSFLGLIERSIRNHWDLPAMTDFQGNTFYYKDFAREIDKLHEYFNSAGIQRGDKISICGKNSANWAISFFATLSYGAVAVSILHEFEKESIQYIVDHSDSKMLFVDESIWREIDESKIPKAETVFSLDDFSLLRVTSKELKIFVSNAFTFFDRKYEKGFFVNDIAFRTDKPEELAVINYTSGTTSSPKGVMIPYRSLWSNTRFANDILTYINSGDNIVCMLPMAHAYGLAFEVLNSISMGCHIHFLGKTPSPKVLLEVFAKIKPKLVLAVPLIIEKIVIKNVFPKLQQGTVKRLIKIPLLNFVVYNKVRKSLIDVFGGNLVEVVIGGAALNADVEKFLRKIKFPYTVGYGMTECGPLISYSFWTEFKERSCGKAVDRMQIKIDSPDPQNVVGEILTKGTNVMLGYYKNEEATKATFTEDGWLKTGDLGILDKDNFLFIRGRNKNMILGPSGQNIYPEEIENKLNNSPYIMESLVLEENGRIVALIVPDTEILNAENILPEQYDSFLEKEIKEINAKLANYSKIASFRIQTEEFEKTPKRSIKRFKYMK
ncbi:MAG TPA: long-chain fatty acid--CoA ligase [Petrimonas sp.]|uniref:AMP-binding protein n=1 Tax=Petrimonas sp. TaxID=2023866 RepID=UPI0009644339|nr:AMP-binding protein [Petrimonas sp.]OJV39133.1 MAG: long-chain fatty acid--CoA ligase [Bacteroidia bacterium 43-41]MEA4950078.1 AMP-binding protein [Petrimonas sp.]MEA4980598.1 AMP-binding protein [Petrimonas sp.]MEA5044316.1 AMP-binding protein [Petrimonas sp.]